MNASLTVDATKANDPAMRELFSSLNKKVLVCQLGSLYMPLSVAAEIHARPVMQRQLPARNSADWLIRRQMSRGMISIDQNCLFCAVHVNMRLLLAAEEQGGLRRTTRFSLSRTRSECIRKMKTIYRGSCYCGGSFASRQ